MKRTKMPPVGAVPRFVREEERIEELKAAIQRFLNTNWSIPEETVREYNELVDKLPVDENTFGVRTNVPYNNGIL